MIIGSPANTFNAFAGQTMGIIDSADNTSVRGWVMNRTDSSTPADVKVVITNEANGQVVDELTATASNHREDLKDMGNGAGNYGFEIAVPWNTYKDDSSYLVEAFSNGQKLSGSTVHGKNSLTANTLHSLGVFKTTAYCPCKRCSGGWGRHTSTGAVATANHTISVDPRVIPYGSRIMINGIIYTAEDCGGGVKGNHIDIFFNTHPETRAYGTRNLEVYLVQ